MRERRPRPRPRGRRRRHLPAGLRRRRQHDPLVLPPPSLRPAAPAPLRPALAEGLGGLPGLQPGHGRRRRRARRRGRRRAGAGLPLLAARAGCWPRPRPDLRTVHFCHTPFADADHARASCPTTSAAELLDGMAGYGACGFHCHKWEAGFARLLRRPAGRTAPRHVRGAARARTPACSTEEAASAECAAAVAALRAEVGGRRDRRCGPTAWSRRRTSCGGCWPSRSCCVTHPEWRGQVVHVALAYPSRQGLAEYLAYGADVVHTAERINHAFGDPAGGWTPIVLSVRGRPGPLARRADAVRRPARQPGARRAQPGGQGGTAAQQRRRRARALARGGRVGGAGARGGRRPRGQPLRRVGDRRRPPHGALDGRPPSGPDGRPRCGRRCGPGRRPTGGPTSWRRPVPGERSRYDATPTMGLLSTIEPVEPRNGGPPEVG